MKKKITKMVLTDLYCEKCSLQFDKLSIFKMHLSIVHKKMVDLEEESICKILIEKPDRTFSEKRTLKSHIASVHEEKSHTNVRFVTIIFLKRVS